MEFHLPSPTCARCRYPLDDGERCSECGFRSESVPVAGLAKPSVQFSRLARFWGTVMGHCLLVMLVPVALLAEVWARAVGFMIATAGTLITLDIVLLALAPRAARSMSLAITGLAVSAAFAGQVLVSLSQESRDRFGISLTVVFNLSLVGTLMCTAALQRHVARYQLREPTRSRALRSTKVVTFVAAALVLLHFCLVGIQIAPLVGFLTAAYCGWCSWRIMREFLHLASAFEVRA